MDGPLPGGKEQYSPIQQNSSIQFGSSVDVGSIGSSVDVGAMGSSVVVVSVC